MNKETHPDELAKLRHPFYMAVWFTDKSFNQSEKMIFTSLTVRHTLMDMLVESKKFIEWNTKYYDMNSKEALIAETTVKERALLNPEEKFIKEALAHGWEFDLELRATTLFLKSIENSTMQAISPVQAMYLKAICEHRNKSNDIK
jgi:hypothetical protein